MDYQMNRLIHFVHDNEITGQGQLERSEGEIETEIWPVNG